ncbi:VOC family protein [Aliiroseovarius sp. F20344]|uniref:VOC family protein n=1 Tax=Aliiroseovarius sp. F20344 TaxID=2926414 RepID=UPI001FF4F7E4|nr:VOC family protein [Aliiroseovarius sp. F20344]MCK0140983.1 VOC family protein [Aliiroseovarius sp. F20344]
MSPKLSALDHLVLTVTDIDSTIAFYQGVLGMTSERFQPADGSTRWALKFGSQKINLHVAGNEFEPKAQTPVPGSADLCLLTQDPLGDWQTHLHEVDIPIIEGPVRRTGAVFPIESLYLRDPEGNLIEISRKLQD